MTLAAFFSNFLRFVLLLLAQVFVLNQIAWGWGGRAYLFVFGYPLFVALLPLRTPRPLVIGLSFLLGLSIDFFSETLGLHAGALTATAYARPLILRSLRPRDGYNIKARPSIADLGTGWMAQYLTLLLLVHLLVFFLLQTFSILFAGEIAIKTALSLPASLLTTGIFVLLFSSKT
ncbi:hypothetical protein LEM8419_01090 [Neolewinella maritima]|uniref:Rod shape-determining protein MreD n=1 Tax=Neolewinella maritima TaxID=1383882 RepID=A0ABN8F4V3_9BACT|nr:hypothetical protein [Neolewinella maritima]CAH0999790.1 hypothetical protein LEM8419_01090 [Neolewinella maritima]